MKKSSAPARYRFLLFVLSAALLLPFCPRAHALNRHLDISQYARTSWKNREGFLNGVIGSIAQTADGYLWLGTDSGLYRFDGVRAVAWQPPSSQRLPTNYISTLLVTRDGTLWIGTVKGLASWKGGKLTQYPELDGMGITGLVQDGDGVVWAAGWTAAPPGKLCTIQHDTTQCIGRDGGLGRGPVGLFEDSKGNLWLGMKNGLWRWKPGPPRFYPLAGEPMGIQGLAEGDDGALLISMTGRIARLADGKPEDVYLYPNPARESSGHALLRDQDGSLWIGTIGGGLVHVHQESTDVFGESDGLTGSVVSALFQDREGDVWVATSAGLERFRDFSVATVSAKEGFLCASQPGSIVAGRDGSIWQGGLNGLCRWRDGQVTLYHEPDTKFRSSPFGIVAKVQEITASGFPNHAFMSEFEDEFGRVWVLATGGVGYLQNGRFTRLRAIPGGDAFSISGDPQGNLWISNWEHGLLHIRGQSLVEQVPWTQLGGNGFASALVADSLRGGVWLGFSNGSLAHFDSGRLSTTYTAADGLGEGRVNDLRIDPDGTLWAATAGGLSRVNSNRVATLSSANALPCETVHWSIEDNDHNLWLYMPCGLVRIAHSELEAWENDPSRRIQTTLFDASDGVWTHGFSGHGLGPSVAKSPDGRLWFTSQQGLSVIDPHHLAFNRLPPPVHIEQITVDRKTYEATLTSNVSMRLPAQVRDLKIDYTALSFVAPQKVLFRYKLKGWDLEWQDAGTRRQAFYSNLPPGDYRFRITASNNSGVWNEQGATLDFSIAPAYWQTNGFRALCAVAFLLLLWAIYWLRLRHLTRTFNMTLEARVNERTRIARELHDTLLQSLHGLMFEFQAVRNLLPRRPDEAMQSLDHAIDDTERALAESRDAIQDLRSEPLARGNLAALLMAASRELAKSGTADQQPPVFELIKEGEKRALSSTAKNEVCRIALEILRNAYRHAHATRIEAEIRYDDRILRVRIRDNGRGIDSRVLKEVGIAGHWGLRGVRERAERIGARLDFWSEAGAGTEVQLTVPADVAYQTAADDVGSRLLRKVRSRAEHS